MTPDDLLLVTPEKRKEGMKKQLDIEKKRPSLSGRRILRFMQKTEKLGGRLWRSRCLPWNDSAIELLIRQGWVEAIEHGKQAGKHRVLKARLTRAGRDFSELRALPPLESEE